MITKENKHLFKPGDLVRYNKNGGVLGLVLQCCGNPSGHLSYKIKWCNTGKITGALEYSVEAAY